MLEPNKLLAMPAGSYTHLHLLWAKGPENLDFSLLHRGKPEPQAGPGLLPHFQQGVSPVSMAAVTTVPPP